MMDDIIERSEFEKAIREGNIENVKFLTKGESFVINQNIGHKKDVCGDVIFERPLSVSL